MAELTLELSGMTQALYRAFQTWGKHSPKYSKLITAFPVCITDIIQEALSELQDTRYKLKPGGWEVWWATHHNRFVRRPGVTQKEMLRMHEVMYHFLTALARNELDKNDGADDSQHKKAKSKAVA